MKPISDLALILGVAAVPLASVIMGFILWRNPPGINKIFGFRTKLSMSSEKLWHYAQTLSGKLMVIAFAPMLVISAAVSAFAVSRGFNSDLKFWLLGGLIVFEIVLLIAVNISTDRALKRSFKKGDADDDK